VTCFSCIAWSSAAWVLGGVRLISSASTMFAEHRAGDEPDRRLPVAESSSITSVR